MSPEEKKLVVLEKLKILESNLYNSKPCTLGQCQIETSYSILEIEKYAEELEFEGEIQLSEKESGVENISKRKVVIHK